ncbi:MAG: element excision factor XisI family protein [Saprospiraceae bacterium]
MDKLKKHKKILTKVLERHAAIKIDNMPLVSSKLIIDEALNNFLVFDIGWHNKSFVHNIVFHFEIKEGKIYAYKNASDFDIIGELIEAGIPENEFIIPEIDFFEPKNILEEAA